MSHVTFTPASAVIPAASEASRPSRLLSVLVAGLLVLLGFSAVVLALRQTDSLTMVAMFVAAGALAVAWPRLLVRMPWLRESLQRERGLLVAGAAACALVYPFMAGDPYQLHVLAMGGLFALMALGLNITTGYAGLADFGYIAYYAIGAYVSALLNVRLGLNFWLCLPLSAVLTGALSLCVAFPAVRVRGHYLALVSLGFSFIVIQSITNLEWLTGGTQGVFGIQPPSVLGHSFQQGMSFGSIELPYQANFYYLALALICLAVLVCARLRDSRWGRAWGAMRADETAASAAGLDLMKLKLLAFGTGASFGGVAGSVYAHMIGFIDPSSFRVIESIFLLAIVAIGNWRVGGVIVAAVLFTLLPEKMRAFEDWRLLIFAVVLLLVMLARGRRMVSSNY